MNKFQQAALGYLISQIIVLAVSGVIFLQLLPFFPLVVVTASMTIGVGLLVALLFTYLIWKKHKTFTKILTFIALVSIVIALVTLDWVSLLLNIVNGAMLARAVGWLDL